MMIDNILKSSIHYHGSVVMCERKPSQEPTPLHQHLAVAIFDKSHIIIIVTHVRCDFDLAENLFNYCFKKWSEFGLFFGKIDIHSFVSALNMTIVSIV